MQIFVNFLSEIRGRSLYTCLKLLLGADEVNGESWQLVTTLHDDSTGLILLSVTLIRL
jgi:hypothetical protein